MDFDEPPWLNLLEILQLPSIITQYYQFIMKPIEKARQKIDVVKDLVRVSSVSVEKLMYSILAVTLMNKLIYQDLINDPVIVSLKR